MIFVSVGTTAFDSLVKTLDIGITSKNLHFQIADGKYTPKNHPFFRYTQDIATFYEQAEAVITHGGAGTLFSLMHKSKKVLAVPNTDRKDVHQKELIKALTQPGHILACFDLSDLLDKVYRLSDFQPQTYSSLPCSLDKRILDLVK